MVHLSQNLELSLLARINKDKSTLADLKKKYCKTIAQKLNILRGNLKAYLKACPMPQQPNDED